MGGKKAARTAFSGCEYRRAVTFSVNALPPFCACRMLSGCGMMESIHFHLRETMEGPL